MTFKIARTTPTSAVASAGTLAFSYPDGTTAGSYAEYGHRGEAKGLQFSMSQDAGDFSLSFDASEITLTYNGSTPLPANKEVVLQLNLRGVDSRTPYDPVGTGHMKRMAQAGLFRIDLGSPDQADANGIVESQDLTSAGVYSVLAFNGVYGDTEANLKAVLDVPRNVVAAWTTTAVLTVTGKDEYGNTLVESSASGESFTGKKAFKEITDISVSANVTGLTVGTGDVLGLPVYVEDALQIVAEYEDNAPLAREPEVVRVPFQIDQTDLLAATPISLRCPVDGTIQSVKTIVWKTVGTGGSITMKVNNTSVDGLAVVVADSAAAGDVDSDAPTAGHASTAVSIDDELELIPAAAFDTTGAVTGFIEIALTSAQQCNGALVAGVQTKPTATTGDVRGTYDPTSACDGSLAFSLLASLPDPAYKGVTQYSG